MVNLIAALYRIMVIPSDIYFFTVDVYATQATSAEDENRVGVM
ncbi:MAG: hypothetical protein WBI44_08455 [Syntrophaceticus sp.]